MVAVGWMLIVGVVGLVLLMRMLKPPEVEKTFTNPLANFAAGDGS